MNFTKRLLYTVLALMLVTTFASAKPLNTIQAGPGIAVVETQSGTVQGYVHNGVYIYHGIPYATAERFAEPKPVEKWNGIRPALVWGDMAPQDTSRETDMFPSHWNWPYWEPHNVPMSEDCLNLNVWTNGINDGKKRPVMVWFHGGGFVVGDAISDMAYDGENLARTGDVVVVSVTHRLGVLGFLDLSAYGDEYKHSGNLGIVDLEASLKWIRDNIAQFGGDPSNVTIFGQSGGGAKVLALMATPSAKGLFHKGIVQSAALIGENPVSHKVAELVMKNLGVTSVEQLKKVPFAELNAAGFKAMAEAGQNMWRPMVDGDYIPDPPVAGTFTSISKDVPLMIGTALNEWVTLRDLPKMMTLQSDNKNNWTPEQVQQKMKEKYGDKADAVAQAFQKAYPNKKPADALFVENWLRQYMLQAMNTKADQKGAPVYSYVFTWETPVMGGFAMSYHCSELPFVFNNIDLTLTATGGSKEARKLAQTISSAWVNFARTGSPNAKGLPQWEPYTTDKGATMILDNKSVMGYNHDKELLKLLKQ